MMAVLGNQPIQPTKYGLEQLDGMSIHVDLRFLCTRGLRRGPLLFADVWRRHAGREAFIDVPLSNEVALAWVKRQNLREQRQLLRMCRGERVEECVTQLWASSGPEMG